MTAFEKAVLDLANDMRYKFEKNKNKPCPEMNPDQTERRWDTCSLDWLLSRLRGETDELEVAIKSKNFENALLECGDVANFAAFIHDNIKRFYFEV